MRTEELVAALAADRRHGNRGPRWRISGALIAGFVISGGVFLHALGVRSDIGQALQDWRFDLKMAILVFASAVAIVSCLRSVEPMGNRTQALLYLIPLLLVVAVLSDLVSQPQQVWSERLVGTNAGTCLTAIPMLSLAPLVLLLMAARAGAPSSPTRAGAHAGLAASAMGAILYGLHCFDDSPLFVAAWYPIAAAIVVVVGALVGSRLLRW